VPVPEHEIDVVGRFNVARKLGLSPNHGGNVENWNCKGKRDGKKNYTKLEVKIGSTS
jgi:hypothetical protein